MLKKVGNTGLKNIRESGVYIPSDYYQGNENPTLPRPTLNVNLDFKTPMDFGPEIFNTNLLGNWSISIFGTYKAGDFISQSQWNPASLQYVPEMPHWPDYYMVNLKISKSFKLAGFSASVYCDINNVLNLQPSIMSQGYCFTEGVGQGNADFTSYMASLRLPIYSSAIYNSLRAQNPGMYQSGNDKVGDLRSKDKPYIDDPNNPYFLYGQPRDIWVGLRIDF